MAESNPEPLKRPRTPRKNPTPRKCTPSYEVFSSPEDGVRLLAQKLAGIQPIRTSPRKRASAAAGALSISEPSGNKLKVPKERTNKGRKSDGGNETDTSTQASESSKKSKKKKKSKLEKEIAKYEKKIAKLKGSQGSQSNNGDVSQTPSDDTKDGVSFSAGDSLGLSPVKMEEHVLDASQELFSSPEEHTSTSQQSETADRAATQESCNVTESVQMGGFVLEAMDSGETSPTLSDQKGKSAKKTQPSAVGPKLGQELTMRRLGSPIETLKVKHKERRGNTDLVNSVLDGLKASFSVTTQRPGVSPRKKQTQGPTAQSTELTAQSTELTALSTELTEKKTQLTAKSTGKRKRRKSNSRSKSKMVTKECSPDANKNTLVVETSVTGAVPGISPAMSWKSPGAPKTPHAPPESILTMRIMSRSVEKAKRRMKFSPDKPVRGAKKNLSRSQWPSARAGNFPAGNGEVSWVDEDMMPLEDNEEEDLQQYQPHLPSNSGDAPAQGHKITNQTLQSPDQLIRKSHRIAKKRQVKIDSPPKKSKKDTATKKPKKDAAAKKPKVKQKVSKPTPAILSPPGIQVQAFLVEKDRDVEVTPNKGAKRKTKSKGPDSEDNPKPKRQRRRKTSTTVSNTEAVSVSDGPLDLSMGSATSELMNTSLTKDFESPRKVYNSQPSDMEDPDTRELEDLSRILLSLGQESQHYSSAPTPRKDKPLDMPLSLTPQKTPKKTPLKVNMRFRTPTKTPSRSTPPAPARFLGLFSDKVKPSTLNFQDNNTSTGLPEPPRVRRNISSTIEVLDTQPEKPSTLGQKPSTSGVKPSTSSATSSPSTSSATTAELKKSPVIMFNTPAQMKKPARRSFGRGRASIGLKKRLAQTYNSKFRNASQSTSQSTVVVEDAEASGSQFNLDDGQADSPGNRLKIVEVDADDDEWEDEELEQNLEEKASAQMIPLTAVNVKSIIREVVTNEQVITMVRNTLMEEEGLGDELKEAIFEPRLTRGKVKKAMEKGNIPATIFPLTPVKGAPSTPQPKKFADLELPDDEEDDDYDPIFDESDVDSESVVSSRASDFGSPRSQLSKTPTPSKSCLERAMFNREHSESQSSIASESEPPLASRLRSKYSLTDTPLEYIEASFVAPDITPDLYNTIDFSTPTDRDWQTFLAQVHTTTNSEMNDTYDEKNDPEFNILQDDVEQDAEDFEEKRNDRGVKITKKEITSLMDELFEVYEHSMMEFGKELIPDSDILQASMMKAGISGSRSTSPTKQAFRPQPLKMDTPGSILAISAVHGLASVSESGKGKKNAEPELDPSAIPEFSKDELIQLQDQMRKHVQLLAQTFVLSASGEKYRETGIQAAKFVDEMKKLGEAHVASKGTGSYFLPTNLNGAFSLVTTGLPTSSDTDMLQTSVWKRLQRKGWKRSLGQKQQNKFALMWPQMETLCANKIFLFPQMLPELRFYERITKPLFSIFTEAEDNLIALGLAQFEKAGKRKKVFELIREYMMPTKTLEQMMLRVKRQRSKDAADNIFKDLRDKGTLPEFERYLELEDEDSICAPDDRDPDIMPSWFKFYERVKTDYTVGKLTSLDLDTSRCSTPDTDSLDDSASDTSAIEREVRRGSLHLPTQHRKTTRRAPDKRTSAKTASRTSSRNKAATSIQKGKNTVQASVSRIVHTDTSTIQPATPDTAIQVLATPVSSTQISSTAVLSTVQVPVTPVSRLQAPITPVSAGQRTHMNNSIQLSPSTPASGLPMPVILGSNLQVSSTPVSKFQLPRTPVPNLQGPGTPILPAPLTPVSNPGEWQPNTPGRVKQYIVLTNPTTPGQENTTSTTTSNPVIIMSAAELQKYGAQMIDAVVPVNDAVSVVPITQIPNSSTVESLCNLAATTTSTAGTGEAMSIVNVEVLTMPDNEQQNATVKTHITPPPTSKADAQNAPNAPKDFIMPTQENPTSTQSTSIIENQPIQSLSTGFERPVGQWQIQGSAITTIQEPVLPTVQCITVASPLTPGVVSTVVTAVTTPVMTPVTTTHSDENPVTPVVETPLDPSVVGNEDDEDRTLTEDDQSQEDIAAMDTVDTAISNAQLQTSGSDTLSNQTLSETPQAVVETPAVVPRDIQNTAMDTETAEGENPTDSPPPEETAETPALETTPLKLKAAEDSPSKILSPANLLLTGGNKIETPNVDACEIQLEPDEQSFNDSVDKSFDSDTSMLIMNTPRKFVPNEETSCSPNVYSDRSYSNSPGFSDNTPPRNLNTPTKSAVEIMAAYAEYITTPPRRKTPYKPSNLLSSTPSPRKRFTPSKLFASPPNPAATPPRFRTIIPKPGVLSPCRPLSPIFKKKNMSPRKKILQQKARAILPKGFVASTFSLSPTKKAAASLTKRARTRSGFRKILPKAEMRRLDLNAGEPSTTADENEDTDIDILETDFASEYDTLDSEFASEDNQSADEKENDAKALSPKPVSVPPPKVKRQRRYKKKKEKKPVDVDGSGSEDDGFGFGLRLGAESQDEAEEEDPLAQFMAASTTIRFDPKSKSAIDRLKGKSKAKGKREMTLHMLAPDLVGADVLRDERDTAFAQAYLTRIKTALKDNKETLEAFLKLLYEFGQSQRTPVELHAEMELVLADHPEVLADFSGFLLPDQAQQCGCFVTNLEFGRARSFLRKIETFFSKHPAHLQKILKAFATWNKTKGDVEVLRTQVLPLLRGQQHLIDQFTSLFPLDKPNNDHIDDFEEVHIKEGEDSTELPNSETSVEEVSLPEASEDGLYGTIRCRCQCHDVNYKQYSRLKVHCHSCSMKIVQGKIYMQTMEKTLRPVQVQYLGNVPSCSQPEEAQPIDIDEDIPKDDALSSDEDAIQDPLVLDAINEQQKIKKGGRRRTKSTGTKLKVKFPVLKPQGVEPLDTQVPDTPSEDMEIQDTPSEEMMATAYGDLPVVTEIPVVRVEYAEPASPINITQDSAHIPQNVKLASEIEKNLPTDFSILRTEIASSNQPINQPETLESPTKIEFSDHSYVSNDISAITSTSGVTSSGSPFKIIVESTMTGAIMHTSTPRMRIASKDIKMTQQKEDDESSGSSMPSENSNSNSNSTSTSQATSNSNDTIRDVNSNSSSFPSSEAVTEVSSSVRTAPSVSIIDESANHAGQSGDASTAKTSDQILLHINLNSQTNDQPVSSKAKENSKKTSSSQNESSENGKSLAEVCETEAQLEDTDTSEEPSRPPLMPFIHDDATMGFNMIKDKTQETDQMKSDSSNGKGRTENLDSVQSDNRDNSMEEPAFRNLLSSGMSPAHSEVVKDTPAPKTNWNRSEDREILITCQQMGPTPEAFTSICEKLPSHPTVDQVEGRYETLMAIFLAQQDDGDDEED